MLVDQIADLVDVSLRQNATLVDQQDVGGHRLDFVEDVTRDQHALAGAAPLLDQADRLSPPEGIHARQRFVEDDQVGVVRERLRELHALAHALAVGANLLARRLHEVDLLERAVRELGRRGVAHPVQARQRGDPLEPGHAVVEGVLFGAEADAEVEAGILPDRLAEHRDRALTRLELAGDEFHERGLAGPVGPQQARNARRDGHGDVVQPAHLAVPLGQVLCLDDGGHATTSTPRTRRSSTNAPAPMSSAIMSSDTGQGVS